MIRAINALLVIWMYCHSLAHDHGFQNQAFFQTVYDVSRSSTGDDGVACRLVRAASMAMYDCRRGIVSRSPEAYAYLDVYHREIVGRLVRTASVAVVFVARHAAALQIAMMFVAVVYIQRRVSEFRRRLSWTSSSTRT